MYCINQVFGLFHAGRENTKRLERSKKRQYGTINQQMKTLESGLMMYHVNGSVRVNLHLSAMPSIAQLSMAPVDILARGISFAIVKDEESEDKDDIATSDFGGSNDDVEEEKDDNDNNDNTT